jgi:hypothetical protein
LESSAPQPGRTLRLGDANAKYENCHAHFFSERLDASLVIEGKEFAGNVVRYAGSQVIFESGRFEEIAKKLS